MPAKTWPRGNVAGLLATWGVAVGGGMVLMAAGAAGPGEPGSPTARWPKEAAVPLDARRPTLLIFVHPRCPCSRASLAELATLMDRCGDRVAARAVVFRPRRGGEEWSPADLRAAMAEVPGLEVSPDFDGEEARRFAVATSGHVVLYGPRGDRIFSGGITPGRGERGDNAGRAALFGRILGGPGEDPGCPAFGCPLATPRPDPGQG